MNTAAVVLSVRPEPAMLVSGALDVVRAERVVRLMADVGVTGLSQEHR